MTSLIINTKRLEDQTSDKYLNKRDFRGSASTSAILLRIYAAADFYASNNTLMLDPPPVDVDISMNLAIAGSSNANL